MPNDKRPDTTRTVWTTAAVCRRVERQYTRWNVCGGGNRNRVDGHGRTDGSISSSSPLHGCAKSTEIFFNILKRSYHHRARFSSRITNCGLSRWVQCAKFDYADDGDAYNIFLFHSSRRFNDNRIS